MGSGSCPSCVIMDISAALASSAHADASSPSPRDSVIATSANVAAKRRMRLMGSSLPVGGTGSTCDHSGRAGSREEPATDVGVWRVPRTGNCTSDPAMRGILVKAKKGSVRALAALMAVALLAGQLPGGQCVMAHETASPSATDSAPSVASLHHHAAPSPEAPASHHQHDGAESGACTMMVSCGAPVLANGTIALKAVQANSDELTPSIAAHHLNPTLLAHTPPPRA